MSTNGQPNLTGADIDPDAGLLKLTITLNPVSNRLNVNANTDQNVALFGMMELAKLSLSARIKGNSSILAP